MKGFPQDACGVENLELKSRCPASWGKFLADVAVHLAVERLASDIR